MKAFCAGIYEKFADAFSKAVENLKVGDGFGEGVAQVFIYYFLAEMNVVVALSIFSSVWSYSTFRHLVHIYG